MPPEAVIEASRTETRAASGTVTTIPATTESSRARRFVRAVAPTTIFIVVLIVGWQLWTLATHPRPDLFPGPTAVASSLGNSINSGLLWQAIGTSLGRGAIGFILAIVVATPLGLLLSEANWLRRAVGPILSGLQVLPSVAWVPAAILWFGLTDAAVYFVVILGAVPSITNGLLAGIDAVPPELRRVGTVLGASRRQVQTRILLPAALPSYVAGLRQGWAFAWRSLMAAEIIAGSLGYGLGTMLENNRELADMPGVLATIIAILAVGVFVELVLFAPVSRRLLRRRGLSGATK